MRTECIRVKLSPEEKGLFQDLANNCCQGNLSAMIRRAVNGGHAASRISSNALEELIRKVFREEKE